MWQGARRCKLIGATENEDELVFLANDQAVQLLESLQSAPSNSNYRAGGGRNLWERSWWGEWAFGQLQHKKGRRPPLSSSQSLLETTLEEKAFPFPGYIAVVNMGCALAAPLIKVLISSFLSPLLLFTSMKMSTGVFRFPNKQQYNNFRVKDIGRYVDLSSITFLTTQLPPASPTHLPDDIFVVLFWESLSQPCFLVNVWACEHSVRLKYIVISRLHFRSNFIFDPCGLKWNLWRSSFYFPLDG